MKQPTSSFRKFSFKKVAIWALLFGIAIVILGCIHTMPGDQPEAETRFHFVQISDTHLGEHDHLQRTRELVDQINRLPFDIACVVHTGDVFADNITDEMTIEEGLAIFKQLKAPVHILPGNHDILVQNLEKTLSVYIGRVGPLIFQREYHGVEFIFVYTEPLALGFEVKGYDVLKELNQALIGTYGKPVLLFHHRPAVEDYYEFNRYPGWNHEARRQFNELLSAYDTRAVITGHFHRDELHWTGSIPIFAAPPVAGYWGRQASFRLYEYVDGKLTYRTIYLQQ